MAILRNRSTGATLAEGVAYAVTPLRRVIGLLSRNDFDIADNVWFEHCPALHTLGMRAAIDVVFLDGFGRVLACCPGVPPGRPSVSYSDARAVLKMAQGFLFRTDVLVGDVLVVDAG